MIRLVLLLLLCRAHAEDRPKPVYKNPREDVQKAFDLLSRGAHAPCLEGLEMLRRVGNPSLAPRLRDWMMGASTLQVDEQASREAVELLVKWSYSGLATLGADMLASGQHGDLARGEMILDLMDAKTDRAPLVKALDERLGEKLFNREEDNEKAIRLLARENDPGLFALGEKLYRSKYDRDADVGALALGLSKDRRAIALLAENAFAHLADDRRMETARALGLLITSEDKDVIAGLNKELAAPREVDWHFRQLLLEILGKLGHPSSLPIILGLAKSGDNGALRALAGFDDPAIAPAMVELLSGPRLDFVTAAYAGNLLASRGGPEHAEAILRTFEAKNPNAIALDLKALGVVALHGTPDMIPRLQARSASLESNEQYHLNQCIKTIEDREKERLFVKKHGAPKPTPTKDLSGLSDKEKLVRFGDSVPFGLLASESRARWCPSSAHMAWCYACAPQGPNDLRYVAQNTGACTIQGAEFTFKQGDRLPVTSDDLNAAYGKAADFVDRTEPCAGEMRGLRWKAPSGYWIALWTWTYDNGGGETRLSYLTDAQIRERENPPPSDSYSCE
jgi:hypothetical protein